MNIYLVQGSTGEYSDHREWLIAAFYSEGKAQSLVTAATARANEIMVERNGDYYGIPEGTNQYDPHMQVDYTGVVHYTYLTVEIKDEPL